MAAKTNGQRIAQAQKLAGPALGAMSLMLHRKKVSMSAVTAAADALEQAAKLLREVA